MPSDIKSPFYFEDGSSDESGNENCEFAESVTQPDNLYTSLLRSPYEALSPPFQSSDNVSNSNYRLSSSEGRFDDDNNDKIVVPSIINFPTESTHAYSYAQLSPNSLALRLNVLKRSLEILIDRPDLIMNSLDHETDDDNDLDDDDCGSFALTNSDEETPDPSKNDKVDTNNNNNNRIKIRSNASSAALSAFFTSSNVPSSSNLKILNNKLYDKNNTKKRGSLDGKKKLQKKLSVSNDEQLIYENIREKLKSMIKLLNSNPNLNKSLLTQSLYDKSSTNVMIQKKLLNALATPFYESVQSQNRQLSKPKLMTLNSSFGFPANSMNQRFVSVQKFEPPSSKPILKKHNSFDLPSEKIGSIRIPENPFTHSLQSELISPTSLDNFYEKNINNNSTVQYARPFHNLSTSRNLNPQAIFSCEIKQPWNLLAANDLSKLLFGDKLKSNIKNYKLLDLISSNSKSFVLQKLLKRLNPDNSEEDKSNHFNKDIIFAGEIVAINNDEKLQVQWCSLWAKKKNDKIILMFDKIPCSAAELTVSNPNILNGNNSSTWEIHGINEISGTLFSSIKTDGALILDSISKSITRFIHQNNNGNLVSLINSKRYFTLNLQKNRNLPCAVFSELNSKKQLLLKIHTLPFIAGIFIISASNHRILSYNRSISKNLFGHGDLINQSINKIIPNFDKFLNYSASNKKLIHFLSDLHENHSPNINSSGYSDNNFLSPGLVLPEHFFRRIQSKFEAHKLIELRDINDISNREQHSVKSSAINHVLKTPTKMGINYQSTTPRLPSFDSNSNIFDDKMDFDDNYYQNLCENINGKSEEDLEEELFLNSNGIYGKHEDGSRLTIDVQLRVSNINTFVLWVTSSNDYFMENDESSASSTSDSSPTRTAKLESTNSSISIISMDSNIITSPTQEKDESELIVIKSESELLKEEIQIYKQWQDTCGDDFPTQIGKSKRSKSIKDFHIIKKMGNGAYGKVLLVNYNKNSNYKIIVKCIYKNRILIDAWIRDYNLGTIPLEIKIMDFFNHNPHPNVLKLLDFFEDDDYYYIELPIHGNPPAIDLFDYIEIKKNLTILEIRYIFRQIAHAIHHLHSNDIVHRDIKDENVIIDENSVAKLIDYGSSAYANGEDKFDTFVGTLEYAPPEVLNGKKYEGKAQDIWSLGVLLYTMVYKENPFYNIDEIMEGEFRVPFVADEACNNLIETILNRDIKNRPTISDILKHPWLKDF